MENLTLDDEIYTELALGSNVDEYKSLFTLCISENKTLVVFKREGLYYRFYETKRQAHQDEYIYSYSKVNFVSKQELIDLHFRKYGGKQIIQELFEGKDVLDRLDEIYQLYEVQ